MSALYNPRNLARALSDPKYVPFQATHTNAHIVTFSSTAAELIHLIARKTKSKGKKGKSKIKGGVIAGIVIAIIVVILLLVIVALLVRKRKQKKQITAAPPAGAPITHSAV